MSEKLADKVALVGMYLRHHAFEPTENARRWARDVQDQALEVAAQAVEGEPSKFFGCGQDQQEVIDAIRRLKNNPEPTPAPLDDADQLLDAIFATTVPGQHEARLRLIRAYRDRVLEAAALAIGEHEKFGHFAAHIRSLKGKPEPVADRVACEFSTNVPAEAVDKPRQAAIAYVRDVLHKRIHNNGPAVEIEEFQAAMDAYEAQLEPVRRKRPECGEPAPFDLPACDCCEAASNA